jgi:hypothetical protein
MYIIPTYFSADAPSVYCAVQQFSVLYTFLPTYPSSGNTQCMQNTWKYNSNMQYYNNEVSFICKDNNTQVVTLLRLILKLYIFQLL